jgi:hypothetical protein
VCDRAPPSRGGGGAPARPPQATPSPTARHSTAAAWAKARRRPLASEPRSHPTCSARPHPGHSVGRDTTKKILQTLSGLAMSLNGNGNVLRTLTKMRHVRHEGHLDTRTAAAKSRCKDAAAPIEPWVGPRSCLSMPALCHVHPHQCGAARSAAPALNEGQAFSWDFVANPQALRRSPSTTRPRRHGRS